MNSENRDFIIERLERQLKEKEAKIEDIKTTLCDSILREIRSDLKSDLDINNRIVQLEQKVQALSSNLNGIMDELLDQKSMIRSLGELSVSKHKSEEHRPEEPRSEEIKPVQENPVEKTEPKLYRPDPEPVTQVEEADTPEEQPPYETPVIAAPVKPYTPPQMAAPPRRSENSNVSIRSNEEAPAQQQGRGLRSPGNLRFNIRDAAPAVRPEVEEPEPSSEYIVAETDDEREMRTRGKGPHEHCDYIVADEESKRRQQTENEYETVEAREDEDAVITITRRK